MLVTVPLDDRHCPMVAELHLKYLRTQFHGFVGAKLLQYYYMGVARCKGACGFVALDGTEIVGYVCGVWDASALRNATIVHYLPLMFVWAAVHAIAYPKLFLILMRRAFHIERGSARTIDGYELRPIVVAPPARGTGVAEALVDRILQDASLRHFEKIYLLTETDNIAANAFYVKRGFEMVGQEVHTCGTYNVYELPTGAKA